MFYTTLKSKKLKKYTNDLHSVRNQLFRRQKELIKKRASGHFL